MSKQMAERFLELERDVSSQRGGFNLFALFAREDVPDRWDLVISAPWFSSDRKPDLDYFVREIKEKIGQDYLVSLSRIVLVDPDNPAVDAVNRAMQTEHNIAEVQNSVFFGLQVPHAYIITSMRTPPKKTAKRKKKGSGKRPERGGA